MTRRDFGLEQACAFPAQANFHDAFFRHPQDIRATLLLLRQEVALLDVRHEAQFATGHPLFAANMAAGRIALEAGLRLPRKDAPIVLV